MKNWKWFDSVLALGSILLLWCTDVAAANIYIAPGGTGSGTVGDPIDLQGGLDSAAANMEDDVLHLQAGTYSGNFNYLPATDNGSMEIQGGWDGTFSTRSSDPAATVLEGGGSGSVLQINDYSNSTVTSVIVIDGVTVRRGNAVVGGGVYTYSRPPGSITLRRLILEDNQAESLGGGCVAACGIWDPDTPQGCDITLADLILRNNTVTGYTDGSTGTPESGEGGGCALLSTAKTTITNILAYGNRAGTSHTYEGMGGGMIIDVYAGTVTFTNNTVTGNIVYQESGSTNGTGGGFHIATADSVWGPADVSLFNSIVYDNTSESPQGSGDIYQNIGVTGPAAGSTIAISHCNYQDMNIGSSPPDLSNVSHVFPNFSTDPATLYYLTSRSACVDAGSNSAPAMPGTDLAGVPRPQDGDSDGTALPNLGCYEQVVAAPFSWNLVLPAITGKKR